MEKLVITSGFSNLLLLAIQIALSSFWIVYLFRIKACPFGICEKIRNLLDFKPFNCFFCLSAWVSISFFAFFCFFPAIMGVLVTLFSVLGVELLLLLYLSNLEYKE